MTTSDDVFKDDGVPSLTILIRLSRKNLQAQAGLGLNVEGSGSNKALKLKLVPPLIHLGCGTRL